MEFCENMIEKVGIKMKYAERLESTIERDDHQKLYVERTCCELRFEFAHWVTSTPIS